MSLKPILETSSVGASRTVGDYATPEQVKHTPGPWERRVDWTGSVIRIEGRESPDEQRRIIGYATTFSMAEIIGGKNHADGGKAYANARLIVAAPTMHEYIAKLAAAGCPEAQEIINACR